MPIRMRAHAHAKHQWLGCGAAFLLHRDARPAPIWHGTSRSFPDYFPQTERIKIAATYLELVPSRLAAVRHHLEMPESGRFIHNQRDRNARRAIPRSEPTNLLGLALKTGAKRTGPRGISNTQPSAKSDMIRSRSCAVNASHSSVKLARMFILTLLKHCLVAEEGSIIRIDGLGDIMDRRCALQVGSLEYCL